MAETFEETIARLRGQGLIKPLGVGALPGTVPPQAPPAPGGELRNRGMFEKMGTAWNTATEMSDADRLATGGLPYLAAGTAARFLDVPLSIAKGTVNATLGGVKMLLPHNTDRRAAFVEGIRHSPEMAVETVKHLPQGIVQSIVEHPMDFLVAPQVGGVAAASEGAMAEGIGRGIAAAARKPFAGAIARAEQNRLLRLSILNDQLEMEGAGIVHPVDRFLSTLEQIPYLKKLEDADFHLERASRLRAAQGALRAAGGGEAGDIAALTKLKGPFNRRFGPRLINMLQNDVDGITNVINDSKLRFGDQLTAKSGFYKVLSGVLPNQSELEMLRRVFGNRIAGTIASKKDVFAKLGEAGLLVANVPRMVMASTDLSAPFRQGMFLISHPGKFSKAFGEMFKYFGSEKYYQAAMDDIYYSPAFKYAQKYKLSLTGLTEYGGEEAFSGVLVSPIGGKTLFGKAYHSVFQSEWSPIHMSERAYTGFLNKLRFDTFKSLIKDAEVMGLKPARNQKLMRDIARFVNVATGRGESDMLTKHGALLNTFFFSPRLVASRLTMMNPVAFFKLHPMMQREAMKSLIAVGSANLVGLQLAKMGGLDISTDTENADFGKIRVGNTRYDMSGGMLPYIRLAARFAQFVHSRTQGEAPEDFTATLGRFARTKEAPMAGMLHDFLSDNTFKGEPWNTEEAIKSRLIPMYIQDTKAAVEEWGPSGYLRALPGMFGVGVQTYED